MRAILCAVLLAVLAGSPGARAAGSSQLPDIRDTWEYEAFYGLADPLSAPSLWLPQIGRWADSVCSMSLPHRYAAGRTEPWLPGEHLSDRSLLYPGSALFTLTGPGLVTDRKTNVYTRASEPHEDVFVRRLSRYRPHSLTPPHVMKIALETTGGDYGLAVLTAHYVFKGTAFTGRKIISYLEKRRNQILNLIRVKPSSRNIAPQMRKYKEEFDRGRRLLAPLSSVARALVSLRADPGATPDKMGPWYHIFALFTIDAYGDAGQARTAGTLEHAAKWLKAFQSESGFNKEKATIDYVFGQRQSQCRRGMLDTAKNLATEMVSATHACADSNIAATMHASSYTRGMGGGQTASPVKQKRYICGTRGYTEITGRTFTSYTCKSAGFRDCSVTRRSTADTVTNDPNGRIIYSFEKGKHWTTLTPSKRP
ncbi:MAG: hypothetical protein H6907_10550 [Hyphomicrobiales bacterium]|nr:hypothetical protein [Hyphomicrobiales bacterium]